MKTDVSTGLSAADGGARAGRDAARSALETLSSDRVDFCHLFCSTEYEYEAVIDEVRSVIGSNAELIGCSATSEFTEAGVVDEGVVVGLVASDSCQFFTGLGTGLGTSISGAVRDAVGSLPANVDGYPFLSAINLHDGLTGVGEQLALITQRQLGPRVSVVGGAASDNYRFESTCVFRNDRVVNDAVVIALIASEDPPAISVGHGHEPISEPFEVTRADDCVVHELDGKPAYEVWKNVVADRVREEFDLDIDDVEPNDAVLSRIMGSFEFGIDQGEKYKIRWPRVEADGERKALHFAVDIPEGTVLRVMHGSRDEQIRSARETARNARADAETAYAGAFIYDCACREIILGDEFGRAVDAMAEELGVPLCGFETYGEMCMQMGQLSGYHNTTTVVMLLPE
jgi:methyl-accepting chemotaxis protein